MVKHVLTPELDHVPLAGVFRSEMLNRREPSSEDPTAVRARRTWRQRPGSPPVGPGSRRSSAGSRASTAKQGRLLGMRQVHVRVFDGTNGGQSSACMGAKTDRIELILVGDRLRAAQAVKRVIVGSRLLSGVMWKGDGFRWTWVSLGGEDFGIACNVLLAAPAQVDERDVVDGPGKIQSLGRLTATGGMLAFCGKREHELSVYDVASRPKWEFKDLDD
ncbi:hypothetical protein BJY52DRAFT_1418144 [Lactarius psammicola]|nr:hypothetical protein BJY52DRAFT_1418144 [Lactarius psammicola]